MVRFVAYPMRFLLVSICFSLLVLLPSCRAPKDMVFREIRNVGIESLGFTSSKLTAELEYYNPNNFGLELNRTDVDVFLNNQLLGHSTQDIQLKIPKRGNFIVPVVLDLDMKNLLKNGLAALMNKEVNIKVAGKIKLGKAGVYKTFPVDYSTTQKINLLN